MATIADALDQHAEAGVAEPERHAPLADRHGELAQQRVEQGLGRLEPQAGLQSRHVGDVDQQHRGTALGREQEGLDLGDERGVVEAARHADRGRHGAQRKYSAGSMP